MNTMYTIKSPSTYHLHSLVPILILCFNTSLKLVFMKFELCLVHSHYHVLPVSLQEACFHRQRETKGMRVGLLKQYVSKLLVTVNELTALLLIKHDHNTCASNRLQPQHPIQTVLFSQLYVALSGTCLHAWACIFT